MRVLFFGSYDEQRHPRVRVLIEGFREHGDEVLTCNVPLGVETAGRLDLLRRPWRGAGFGVHLAKTWIGLRRRARRLPSPDAVVVGYMGHFDVHLARRLWPGIPLVLDHLISAADTARDRRVGSGVGLRALAALDRAALGAADLVILDTEESQDLLPLSARSKSCVVRVGVPRHWYHAPRRMDGERLKIVFFGLFTPLQGTPTIARAAASLGDQPIDFLMIGTGQDYARARELAGNNGSIRWLDWVAAAELAGVVASHDVCLGIFGTRPKAYRVVPNKVYQGAAAGCAVVTARTPVQERVLGEAAVYVPAGEPRALAGALLELDSDRDRLFDLRLRAHSRAVQEFSPAAVVGPLRARMTTVVGSGT